MKVVDFQSLLSQAGVAFIDRGKNVGRGEINIKCPWCASADPSFHMGINLETGHWACWRNRQDHSGKSPVRLLVKLLGMPYWRARELAGLDPSYVDPDGFSSLAARLKAGKWGPDEAQEDEPKTLWMPSNFRPLEDRPATRRHLSYLRDERGFDDEDLADLCHAYDLRASVGGAPEWKNRIILPFYFDDLLVTWTGRAIDGAGIRYRDLEHDLSLVPPKETLYNHDVLMVGGEWLVLVEGPVDTLKLDFYGAPYGVRSVALATNSISEEQLFMLAAGFHNFHRLGVMMDNASVTSVTDSMRMRQNLHFITPDAVILKTPAGAKDAGAATPDQIRAFAEELVR